MALEDDQREWLNAALKGKGRIRSSQIKKQFANYTRRREKVQAVFKDLPSSHINYLKMEMGLKEADKLATAGEFKAAYKTLDTVKALAYATDPSAASQILEDEIRQRVELLEKTVGAQVDGMDRFFISSTRLWHNTRRLCRAARKKMLNWRVNITAQS